MDKKQEELLVIEPLIGYREWNIKLYKIKNKYEFRLIGTGVGSQAGYWKNGNPKAICAKKNNHKVPDFNCECGFYAKKYKIDFIGDLLKFTDGETSFNFPQYTLNYAKGTANVVFDNCDIEVKDISIYGIVELSGRVIEHTSGYRGEKVKIKELLFTTDLSKLKFQFKRKVKRVEKKVEAKQEYEFVQDGGIIDSSQLTVPLLSPYPYKFMGQWGCDIQKDNDFENIILEFKKEEVIKSLQNYYQVPIIYYKDYLERELLK